MNVATTAILLILTLLVIPLATFFFGTPLGEQELAALGAVIWIVGAAWIYCFLLGEITNNVSQVDKLWSLLPIAYTWTITYFGDGSPRMILMSLLVTAWGLRLTWNFSRHGAYRLKFWEGHEDYRWEIVRKKPELQPRWRWTLFNLLFISGYQNILILLFSLPILVVLQFESTPLGWLDYLAAGWMLSMIVMESVADNQQWRYQAAKREALACGETLSEEHAKGFLDSGLWRLSRHPNYFAEQSIWIVFYLFSVAASGQWLNWSISGALLLVILFQGSSQLSEEISAGKYPLYSDYQSRVRKFLPIPR